MVNYIFADKLYIEDYIPARTERVFMCVALWGAEQDTQPSSTPFPAPGCAGRGSAGHGPGTGLTGNMSQVMQGAGGVGDLCW